MILTFTGIVVVISLVLTRLPAVISIVFGMLGWMIVSPVRLSSAPLIVLSVGGAIFTPIRFTLVHTTIVAIVALCMRRRMLISHIGFAFVPSMTLPMRRGVLVFRKRFSSGYFIGIGMRGRLTIMRRMLSIIGRYTVYIMWCRFPVVGILIYRHLNIDEVQDHTGFHIDQ